MKKFFHIFFRREFDLRVKIFHVLAIAGVLLCVTTTIVSIVQGLLASTIINAVTGVISLALLIYSAKGGRQKICYWVTVICIFLILFPSLFFGGGGYNGGMGFFFVFAVVYTVYILEGWEMVIATLFELVYYVCLCVHAYLYPETVVPFASEADILIDVIVGLVAVSVSLGITMYVQLRMYTRQQKDLEQARADAEIASRAKSTFLANMSHEIRTPIHVIMGINELIRTESADSKTKAYNDKIGDACVLLRGLLDNILDMSRIEAGKTELKIAPYRTAELRRMLELVGQSRCASKQLEFRCVDKKMPAVLRGDVEHIRQIVINLLSNAVKYTEKGTVTLSFACERGEEEEDVWLNIAVTDTGIGIEPETVPTLFDTFTRADRPANRYIEGTGLGLAIVKELCSLMGGSIHVQSQVGWGSTFTVKIPQRLAADADVVDPEIKHFVAPEGRVLVVDDNPENLSVMQELLRRTLLQVDVAASGKEALEAVGRGEYHVILLDYMMPEMDGVETMRQLHAIEGFATPVVALTANAIAGTRDLLLEAGFSAYLTKPIPWGQLSALLMDYLPAELVTVVQNERDISDAAAQFCAEYQPMMQPYQINLRDAMPFFDGDLAEYLHTANIFLEHGANGQRTLAELAEAGEAEKLIYAVHSLKGRAKNLGLAALAEEAERIEAFCRGDNRDEAQSLIPHLLYLYRQAMDGLELLTPRMQEQICPARQAATPYSTVEHRRELQKCLDQMQRGPALACIDALLGEAAGEQERELLTRMRSAVTFIRFDEASAIYVDYLRGENTWTLEAES